MVYAIKRLWPFIVILIVSMIAVLGGHADWPAFGFLDAYFIFAIFVLTVGFLSNVVGARLPRGFEFRKGFFACHDWEDSGKLYDRRFKVSRWKDDSFDASKVFSNTASKSTGFARDPKVFAAAIQETCVAELIHWALVIAGFALLFVIRSTWRWLFWALYTLSNLADIVIQRFNRPRLVKIHRALSEKSST